VLHKKFNDFHVEVWRADKITQELTWEERFRVAWAVFWRVAVLVAGLLYLLLTLLLMVWTVVSGEAVASSAGHEVASEIGQYVLGDFGVMLAMPFFGLPLALRWVFSVNLRSVHFNIVRDSSTPPSTNQPLGSEPIPLSVSQTR
jgi:hypothetical protein